MSEINRREFLQLAGATIATSVVQVSKSTASNRIALVNARLIDGTGAAPIDNAIVLVEGPRITSVGTPTTLRVPSNFRTCDLNGLTVVPGLINCNVHLTLDGTYSTLNDWWRFLQQEGDSLAERSCKAILSSGVTTVRDTVDPRTYALRAKHRVDLGEMPGPRIVLGGPVAASVEQTSGMTSRAEGPPLIREIVVPVNSPAAAEASLAPYWEGDFQFSKIVISGSTMESPLAMSRELLHAIVPALHKHELYADCHIHPEDVALGVEAGVDIMQHPELGSTLIPEDVLKRLADSRIFVSPLLNVLGTFIITLQNPEVLTDEEHRSRLAPEQFKRAKALADKIQQWDPTQPSTGLPSPLWKPYTLAQFLRYMEAAKENVRRMIQAGVRIAMGTDAGSNLQFHEFFGHVEELKYYAELGMSPMQALQSATAVAAHACGRPDLGLIQPGKVADIVAVEGDPLRNLDALKEVRFVMKDGVVVTERSVAASGRITMLRSAIEREISNTGKEVGVVVKHLERDDTLVLNDDTRYPMASTYKIPIITEVFRQIAEGRFGLADRVEMTEFDRNTVNYLNEFGPGLRPSIRDLVTMMIIVTDSSATDMLLRRVGTANVTATMQRFGLRSITVDRTVEDLIWDYIGIKDKKSLEQKPYRERAAFLKAEYPKSSPERQAAELRYYTDGKDATRPSDMARLLEMIFRGQVVSKAACETILSILFRQRLNSSMPQLLPWNTPVAHKTGGIGTVLNDVGIISLPDGGHLLVVIFSEQIPSSGRLQGAWEQEAKDGSRGERGGPSSNLVARIVRHAYDVFTVGHLTLGADASTGNVPEPPPIPKLTSEDQARKAIGSLEQEYGIDIGVAAKNLLTGMTFGYNETAKFPMAAMVALPVMLETFKQVGQGRFRLQDRWMMQESDRATLGGYMKEMEPGLDPTVYDLLDVMVVNGDSTATDMLMKRLDTTRINDSLRHWGFTHTSVDRTIDQALWDFMGASDHDPIRSASFMRKYAHFQELLADTSTELTAAHARFYAEPKDCSTPLDTATMLEKLVLHQLFGETDSNRILELMRFSLTRLENPFPYTYFDGWQIAQHAGYLAGIANGGFLLERQGEQIVVAIYSVRRKSASITRDDRDNLDCELNLSVRPEIVNLLARAIVPFIAGHRVSRSRSQRR